MIFIMCFVALCNRGRGKALAAGGEYWGGGGGGGGAEGPPVFNHFNR